MHGDVGQFLEFLLSDFHMSFYSIFFILGFAGEVVYLLLVIIVPIGDNWDAVYTAAQDDPIVAALLALTAVTLVTAIFQFLMWMLCCGKNTSAD